YAHYAVPMPLCLPRQGLWHIIHSEVSGLTEEIRMHDIVEMRKKHPCGSAVWTVTRIGADIKMKCGGCGRVVMLDRVEFIKRRKRVITPGPDAPEVTLGLVPPQSPQNQSNLSTKEAKGEPT
ncbi:MAG: DUF951 domain-containing protein, partial [Christensenellales bacterium]